MAARVRAAAPHLLSDQSEAADATTPSSRVSGSLKIDHAYTLPIEVCTRKAVGTMSHLGRGERGTTHEVGSRCGSSAARTDLL